MILARSRGSALAALLFIACSSTSGQGGESAGPSVKPTKPTDPPRPETYSPTAALPRFTVTAPDPGRACPPLPALAADAPEAQRTARPFAEATRRLACEPELHTLTTAGLRQALGLPDDAALEFIGIGGASVTFPADLTVADVDALFGVDTPVVHVTWQAYHDMTQLGSNPKTGAFDLYGPGVVNLGVQFDVDRYAEDAGKERIVPAAGTLAVGRSVFIGLPDAVLRIESDPDAVPLAVAALEKLAADRALLAAEPDAARPRLGLVGERYRVDRVSSLSEGETTKGLSITPRRTLLPAAAFASALGLAGAKAVVVNREHDVWNLEARGTTRIVWKGLELDIDIDSPHSGRKSVPLTGLEIGSIRILPAG